MNHYPVQSYNTYTDSYVKTIWFNLDRLKYCKNMDLGVTFEPQSTWSRHVIQLGPSSRTHKRAVTVATARLLAMT